MAVAPLFLRRNALRLLRPTGCSAPLREERSLCSGRARRGPECAALRPGHETGPRVRCSRHCECIPIPVPRTCLILLVSCPVRGASRGVTEVGQSESWPEGQSEGRCGAWGRASQALTGRPWVSVRPLERGLPL